MAEKNSRKEFVVKNWTGDFTGADELGCQVIWRPEEDLDAVSKHYHEIADEDLLVLSTDGSLNSKEQRGGWAAIQSGGGGRLIHFASGSITQDQRPADAVVDGEVTPLETELRAPAEALEKAAQIVVQRRAEGKRTWGTIVALTDCHGVLSSVGGYKEQSGQVYASNYCNLKILRSVETLRAHGVRCVFDRTKGHSGVDANETADKVARGQSGCDTWQDVRDWRSPGAGNPIEDLPMLGGES